MKPTQFMASDEALVAHLRDLRCDGNHRHAQLDNPAGAAGDKAKDAAKWPPNLCLRIARGCEDVLRKMNGRPQVASYRSPPSREGAKIATTPSSTSRTRPRTPRKVRFMDVCAADNADCVDSQNFPAGTASGGDPSLAAA